MRDSTLIQRFESRLITLRLPKVRRQRAIQELGEHREDLVRAGLDDGLSETEAAARADQSLGDPHALAQQIVMATRHSSWWGRYPAISFVVLPLIANLFITALAAFLVGFTFYWLMPADKWKALADGGPGFNLFRDSIRDSHLVIIAISTWFLCSLLHRTVSRPMWIWIACIVCSFQGYYIRIGVWPHAAGVNFAYRLNAFRIICAILPFAIAVLFMARHRLAKLNWKKIARTATALSLIPIINFGCATKKSEPTTHTRAWIGGEYRIVAKYHNTPFQSPRIGHTTNYPTSLPCGKAIKVTHIATNSPAYVAGLRSDDYLTEVANKKVKSLRQLRHVLDTLPAGATVQLKAVRDNKPLDLTVESGTEKYHNGGYLAVALPTIVEGWDLWPNPGFSLVFIGYQPFDKLRHDLNGKTELDTAKWHAWCAIFEISADDKILSQTSTDH